MKRIEVTPGVGFTVVPFDQLFQQRKCRGPNNSVVDPINITAACCLPTKPNNMDGSYTLLWVAACKFFDESNGRCNAAPPVEGFIGSKQPDCIYPAGVSTSELIPSEAITVHQR